METDYEPVPYCPPQARWNDHEPRFVHSMKGWDDEHGIEHMTIIRSDTVDDLWQQVRTVVGVVKAAKDREEKPPM